MNKSSCIKFMQLKSYGAVVATVTMLDLHGAAIDNQAFNLSQQKALFTCIHLNEQLP